MGRHLVDVLALAQVHRAEHLVLVHAELLAHCLEVLGDVLRRVNRQAHWVVVLLHGPWLDGVEEPAMGRASRQCCFTVQAPTRRRSACRQAHLINSTPSFKLSSKSAGNSCTGVAAGRAGRSPRLPTRQPRFTSSREGRPSDTTHLFHDGLHPLLRLHLHFLISPACHRVVSSNAPCGKPRPRRQTRLLAETAMKRNPAPTGTLGGTRLVRDGCQTCTRLQG